MKKIIEFEKKTYELFGIKHFKKIVMGLLNFLCFIVTPYMSKEERKRSMHGPYSNYNMDKNHGLSDLKKFKKYLVFNAITHIVSLILCLKIVFESIMLEPNILLSIIFSLGAVINTYCIMLQRYNNIRINEVLDKWTINEEKKISTLKDKLNEMDSKLKPHTYKIKGNIVEKTVTFEKLIDKANIGQLREYKKFLEDFICIEDNEMERFLSDYKVLKIKYNNSRVDK